MKDEIKEIIKNIELILNITTSDMVLLERKNIKYLLDHIINLQDTLKDREEYCYGLETQIINLQEENKKLKQWDCNKDTRNSRQRVANKKLLEENKRFKENYEKEHYLVDKLTRQLNDEYKNTEYQCKQKEDYKSRCEKAIKYIKEHIKYECDDAFNGKQFYSYHLYNFDKNELLEILDKENNNETI